MACSRYIQWYISYWQSLLMACSRYIQWYISYWQPLLMACSRYIQLIRVYLLLTITINGMQQIHPVIYLLLTVTINGMQHIHPVDISPILSTVTIDLCLAPHRWGFYITHSDAPQAVGLLWTSGQLVAEISTWHHTTRTTDIHAPGGIRTHDLGRRAAADLRLRPRGHWDRQILYTLRFLTLATPAPHVSSCIDGTHRAGRKVCHRACPDIVATRKHPTAASNRITLSEFATS